MEIVELTKETRPGVLFRTLQVLQGGGIVLLPTDTIYGLCCDATNERALKKVVAMKGRSTEKGLISLVSDLAMARRFAIIDLWSEKVLESIWPGSVTVLLPKRYDVSDSLTGGKPTIGLRLPDDDFLRELIRQLGKPLVATSANRAGQPHAASLDEFLAQFDKTPAVDLYLERGVRQGSPSAILDLTNRSNPLILRRATLSKQDIESMARPRK